MDYRTLIRPKTLCSQKSEMLLEIKRAKQILINNGYSNSEVDAEIRIFLKRLNEQTTTPNENTNAHTLLFRLADLPPPTSRRL